MVRRIRRDVPTENSSVYTHGHLKKLDGVVTNYMSGIGTWEPISGAATLPAPPDKSVQFNDGLTAFGGSAGFLFDKTTINATLGANASLVSTTAFNLVPKYASAGNITALKGLNVKLQMDSPNVVTGAYGIYVDGLNWTGGGSMANTYGVYVANQDADLNQYGIYIAEQNNAFTSNYNIYSAGEDGQNYFAGVAGFAVAPSNFGGTGSSSPSTSCLVGNDNAANTFAFRSSGAAYRNLIEGKMEVLGHSYFGNVSQGFVDTTSATKVVGIAESFSGNLTGNYGSLNTGSSYAPSSGTPTVIEGTFFPQASSGNFNNFEGVFSEAYFNSTGSVGAIFGVVAIGWAVNVAATVTARIVGVDAQALNNSSIAGTLPAIVAVQTISQNLDNQPVTNQYGVLVQANTDAGGTVVNNYGLRLDCQTAGATRVYNIWSDWNSVPGQGQNFFGAGIQVGSTATNLSEVSGGVIGVGTGAAGSVAGSLRCAALGIAGAIGSGEEFTVTGQASISGSLAIGGAISGSEELTVTGQASVSSSLTIAGSLIGGESLSITGNSSASGYFNAGSYKVGGAAGASGNFTTVDLKTVTVTNGLIVSIV